ncbi:cytochrome b/b6 domain-containing protein [Roseovarius sp. EL26]|uniref:cytochrome b/b6 domain-containing protein n=1 Tax=Roseovarius sp. EL26 TaxID=2126672 RepID=UPI000EA1CBF2|nr:cytochrome b/b6 domain-containing protein [Roseovarius sp. EL26]
MPRHNSPTTYGSVAKSFHWLTALLILSAIPLGIIANNVAHGITTGVAATEADIARAYLLFSLHKTIGVSVFFVALARIFWALSQTKPGLLNGNHKAEALAAETVHWLLYGSLVVVPLSGWIHHAATTGFAPIWWPFGQNLPFVPKEEHLAELTGTLHYILQWVLIGALLLHIAGAVKHHVIDGDATLRRMLPGQTDAHPTQKQPGHFLPFIAALAIWAAAMGGGAYLGWFPQSHTVETIELAEIEPLEISETNEDVASPTDETTTENSWQVQDGSLNIVVSQSGSDVTGGFADWAAAIAYSETADDTGKHGSVDVEINIASLSLGAVTDQAMAADYFNVGTFPTAQFVADLVAEGEQMIARGTLTIRDQSVPVDIPFTLKIDGDIATAAGELSVDRRDFNIGKGVSDEGTLGFGVSIQFNLTATRG